MLRVLFNATALRVPLAGVGQYTLNLARALAALGSVDLDYFDGRDFLRELRYEASPRRAKLHALARRAVPGAYAIRHWLQQRRFDRGSAGHDLYHEPSTLALDFSGATVLTVHDLSWIRHPQAHPPERVRELERRFAPGLAHASRVITGSQFVKQEIADVFGYDAQRIDVIPHGCDPVFHPRDAQATQAVRQRWGLEHGGYFVCVGTLEPRKNVRLAIDAHSRLPAGVRTRFPLVMAGLDGWGDAVGSADVRRVGYLEREDLACLTAGALALVYPSRYEGFGLPPLEAMACGVPPITSNASSLPEVVGDAGLMVDPDDTDAMTQAMQALASNPQARQALARRAVERAAAFTWESSALATVRSYGAALGTPC